MNDHTYCRYEQAPEKCSPGIFILHDMPAYHIKHHHIPDLGQQPFERDGYILREDHRDDDPCQVYIQEDGNRVQQEAPADLFLAQQGIKDKKKVNMSSTSSGSVGRSVPKPPSKRYSMAKGVESSNRKKSGLKSMMIWQVIRKATGARHIKGSLASMAAKMLISRIPAPVNNNCFSLMRLSRSISEFFADLAIIFCDHSQDQHEQEGSDGSADNDQRTHRFVFANGRKSFFRYVYGAEVITG